MTGGTRRAGAVVWCLALVLAGGFGGVGGVGGVAADVGVASGADANEAPLADAGLDREVPINSTVYLDATGSRDPDGSIEGYEWSVERPDGNNMEPVCAECGRTEFVARSTGTYLVTVTVTDDDGAERSDTLRVQVSDVEGPDVALSGPTELAVNATGTFTATMAAGDEDLASVDWSVDGSSVGRQDVDGESATDETHREFAAGTYTVSVRVVDEMGREDTASLTVDVTANGSTDVDGVASGDTSASPSTTSSSGGCQDGQTPDYMDPDCEVDSLLGINEGSVIIQDVDGDGEVTVNNETYRPNVAGGTTQVPREVWDEFFANQMDEESDEGEIYYNENGEGESYVTDSYFPDGQNDQESTTDDYYSDSESEPDIEIPERYDSSGANTVRATGSGSSNTNPHVPSYYQ